MLTCLGSLAGATKQKILVPTSKSDFHKTIDVEHVRYATAVNIRSGKTLKIVRRRASSKSHVDRLYYVEDVHDGAIHGRVAQVGAVANEKVSLQTGRTVGSPRIKVCNRWSIGIWQVYRVLRDDFVYCALLIPQKPP